MRIQIISPKVKRRLLGMCENNIAMMNEYKHVIKLSIHQTHLWDRFWQSLFLIYNQSFKF